MSTSPKRQTLKRSYAGTSPEIRVNQRRQQFIEAGKQLFGTVGYHKTTLRLLCAEAKLTDRYFYESFANIEALLVVVYQELIDDMEKTVLVAVASSATADAEMRMRLGVDAVFRIAEDPLLARIIWIEILGVSPGLEAIYNVTLRRFADLVHNLARALLPAHSTPEAVTRATCMGLIGAVSEMAKDWMHSDYEQPREVLVEGVMLLLLGLMGLVQESVVATEKFR